jgi:hypothetical protein
MIQQTDISDGEQFFSEKPQRGAKEGYLASYFNERGQMSRIIAETNGVDRIRLMTLKMIAGITDDKIRADTFEYFNKTIEAINATNDSANEKNQKINDFCCGEMQGHINAFYDQFIGVTHRLKLGTL